MGAPYCDSCQYADAEAAKLDNNATDYVDRAQRYKLTLEASA
jgi:hypothetical protein